MEAAIGRIRSDHVYSGLNRGGVSLEIRRQYSEPVWSLGGISCYAQVVTTSVAAERPSAALFAHSVRLQPKGPAYMNTSVFNKNNLKTVALLSSLAGALVVFGGAFGGKAGASIGLLVGLPNCITASKEKKRENKAPHHHI